jgi:hypothetical protein
LANQLLNHLQRLTNVRCWPQVGVKRQGNFLLLVNDKGHAAAQEAKSRLNAKGPVHGIANVRQKQERQPMVLGKGLVDVDRVVTDACDCGTHVAKRSKVVTKLAGLGGTPRGLIARIKVQDQWAFGRQLRQGSPDAVLVLQAKVWGGYASC